MKESDVKKCCSTCREEIVCFAYDDDGTWGNLNPDEHCRENYVISFSIFQDLDLN